MKPLVQSPETCLFHLIITNAGTGQRQVTSITSNQSGQTSVNSWDKYKFAYIHNYFLPFLSPNADSGPSSQIHLVFIPVH